MKGSCVHMQLDRDPGTQQAGGIGQVFIQEQIERPHGDESGWQIGKVLGPSRGRITGDIIAPR